MSDPGDSLRMSETIDHTVAAPERPSPPGRPPAPPGFELLDEVGRGGMGVVYRARDLALNREVALKFLQDRFDPDSRAAARFVEEAQITGQLQHPGVPAVHQVGAVADGQPYLAMKLIKGSTLDELLKQGATIDPLAIFEAVAQTVGYAHAHGVIHRDLKPSNVMVGGFGEVQLMDWGLAKVLGSAARPETAADPEATAAPTQIQTPRDFDSDPARAGSVLGTPSYMAPEQAAGEIDKVDARSDVFGLGAILCALLTGKPPFVGQDSESIRLAAVRGQTEEAFARLDASAADPDVIALCKRCLAFEPADRPTSGDAVAAEAAGLRRAADDRARQAERDRATAEARAEEQAKRRRAIQWAAAVVVAVLLLGVVGTGIGLYRANAAQRTAEARRLEAETARAAETRQRELAEAKEAEAKAAQRTAETKEAEAIAVVEFFKDHVFAAGRPKGQGGGLGVDVSLRAAALSSLPTLDKAFANQPLVEARLRDTLGTTFLYLGESARAAEQYERAQALFAHHAGPDHPSTLASMHNLAFSYADMGRNEEALKLHEETLAAQKRVLPPDHPGTLASMHSLANSYDDMGRNEEALKLFEETLTARKRVLPPDHSDTLACMHDLACGYFALGRNEEALKLFEETLAAMKRVLPPDHPDTLASMYDLAGSYADMGRNEEALKLFEETLAAMKRVLPPDHPDTLLSTWGVARSLMALDRGAEAIPLIDECLAKAAGKVVNPRLIPAAIDLRLRHFQKVGDPAGCRTTVEMWEKLGRGGAESLYNAACLRAVAAAVRTKAGGEDAERLAKEDADRAMEWLKKAVAAGFADVDLVEQDEDLAILRDRDDFKALLAGLKEPREPG